jgi:predicted enzyme related to lactoylglutathione lyase
MKVTELAFSAYPVTDLARSRAFCEGVLGLKPSLTGNPNWVEYEIGPHTLGIGAVEGWKPNPDGGSIGFEVEDFDAAIAELHAAGVKFRMEPFPTPVCRMAVVSDPDGNSLVIHKRNPDHH